MIVKFKTREISQVARKLAQTVESDMSFLVPQMASLNK
jgi:hypothetical protein